MSMTQTTPTTNRLLTGAHMNDTELRRQLEDLKTLAVSQARDLADLIKRSARTESRLAQFMLFSGMQTDGRQTLAPRGNRHVA